MFVAEALLIYRWVNQSSEMTHATALGELTQPGGASSGPGPGRMRDWAVHVSELPPQHCLVTNSAACFITGS